MNPQWVCQKKYIFVKTFYWKWKKEIPVMTMQRVMFKTLISQHYSCLRHFDMEKSFSRWLWELCGLSLIRNPCGTVRFHFLILPSFIFLSVFLAFCFNPTCFSCCFTLSPILMSSNYIKKQHKKILFFRLVLPNISAVFMLIFPDSRHAMSTTQTFYLSQMFPSDEVTKASNTESVPPEWGPTPNIIVYASPFPC